MKYPTKEEVEAADRKQLAQWSRHLPTANDVAQLEIINRIYDRFKEAGGMTPEISKSIGW